VNRVTVEAVGIQLLVQDRGRSGLAHLGLGHSGAADRAAYELANRLVGNRGGTPCLEATLGSVRLRFDQPVLMAVTGAAVEIRCGEQGQAVHTSFRVPAGVPVSLGQPSAGLRSYVAVRGGVVGNDVLGSASWDTMAHLGTPPLQSGDWLALGDAAAEAPATDLAPVATPTAGRLELPLWLGPRDDWFTDQAIARIASDDFTVTSDIDRVGARLDGPELPRCRDGELASEGVVLGALQVPPGGRPTLFLADHPVTGGYPVIGVVPARWVDAAAQAVPGQAVRFTPRRS
jgi:biotin-dependent carboxylase-like uncharacterized protein